MTIRRFIALVLAAGVAVSAAAIVRKRRALSAPKEEKKRDALDEALENTFPASDPVVMAPS